VNILPAKRTTYEEFEYLPVGLGVVNEVRVYLQQSDTIYAEGRQWVSVTEYTDG
jgi:hypothetical protein